MNKILKRASALAVALVVGVTMVGCGSKDKESAKALDEQLKAMQTSFTEIAKTLESGDAAALDKIPGIGSGLGAAKEIYASSPDAVKKLGELSKLMSEFEYEIGSVKEESDKSTIKVKIKTYDLAKLMSEAQTKVQSEAAALATSGKSQNEVIAAITVKLFDEIKNNAKEKNFSKEIEVTLTKTSGKWNIDAASMMKISAVTAGGLGGNL